MEKQMKNSLGLFPLKSSKISFIGIAFLFLLPFMLWGQIIGDSNTDYIVDIVDALLIAQYYVGLTPSNFALDYVDVNTDSTIDIVDALLIAQLYVGLITELPGAKRVMDILVSQAKQMMENGIDIFTLDVRVSPEFDESHIDGAINMSWSNGYLYNNHDKLPNTPIIVYCQDGSMSIDAAWFLVDNNHINIFNMVGGYEEWLKIYPQDPIGIFLWIEAESGAVYSPQILKSDSYADNSPDDTASQEIYFEVGEGNNATGSAPSNGHMIYNFGVSKEGNYRAWARVKTPNSSDDSFWVKMDSGGWSKWDNIGPCSEWSWEIAGDYILSSGTHTITFAYCEDGAKFDKLLITSDFAYIPVGLGESEPISGEINPFHTDQVVDIHGNLQVIGTNLCNQSGTQVQLKGVNTHGPQWYPVAINQTIPNLAETWGISIVRLAMYVEDFKNGDFWNGYLAHKDEIKKKICDMADDAIDAGIYVIIDWHIHNNPSNFTQDAKDFFAEMSQRFGGYSHVLFEICNEPEYTDWPVIKSYAQQVIPVIRDNDPDSYENIIIVGTPNWSQYLDVAADSPLTGFSNIMYALHFYAASHKQEYRDRVQYALNKNIPVIATEWSACDYDVSFNDFTEGQTWLNFLNSNKISWINWSFCNRDDASAILKPGVSIAGPWADSNLTSAGSWVKQRIRE
ncbi:MAG: cellulase family glycosylhydrolase [Spirochaetales bacterium]|nr:cellulase family glycosylhydrolase [Spirochaetales bacterium]